MAKARRKKKRTFPSDMWIYVHRGGRESRPDAAGSGSVATNESTPVQVLLANDCHDVVPEENAKSAAISRSLSAGF
jgi:hypothetical protein